jgi:hypothetical protein
MFFVYAGAMSAGTHWPRLQLGDPTHPPDKLLHFIAFGGLLFMLVRARFFAGLAANFLVALLWTALDEITQGIPGLGRSMSMEDIVAGWMGVTTTGLFLWATRPLAAPIVALRRQRFDAMIDLILSRRIGWIGFGVSVVGGIATVGPLSILANGFSAEPTPFQAAVVGAMLGAGSGGAAYLIIAMRSLEESLIERRLCLGCGEAVGEGADSCAACGERPLLAQWLPMPGLSRADILRACLTPTLGAIGVLILGLVLLQAAAVLIPTSPPILRLNAWWNGLSKGMDTNIHALSLAALVAVTVERIRVRMARRIERCDAVCLGCRHDLRSTPANGGIGRCGECGAGFVRSSASAA